MMATKNVKNTKGKEILRRNDHKGRQEKGRKED